jgi:aspartyl-tRNA(Asn)/glutamyl-tRNA(Gln) amidotransferase subunit A
MDAALDVLRRLGAELEECRVRPMASYYDVKIIIAESEIFSVHQQSLIARPATSGPTFAPGPSPPCSSPPTTMSRPRASTAG